MIAVEPLRKKQKVIKDFQATTYAIEFETGIYRTVRPFLIISQLFICAPAGAHRKTRPNRYLKYLHILWCFALYVCLASCVYTEYTHSNINLPTVQKPLFFCEYLVYLIHILHIMVAIYMKSQQFPKFLRTIADFDMRLMEFDVMPKYKLFTLFIGQHLLLVCVHFGCTLIIGYYYSNKIIENFALSTVVYMLPNLILNISLVQYYGLLYAITVRYINLNGVLQLEFSRCSSNVDPLVVHRKLQKIRLLYSNFEFFLKDVTDTFASSIILVYIGSFMNISFNIFLIYKYVNDFINSSIPWIMYSVVWTCMHIGKMFLILYYNYSVQKQKSTTALLLNDINGLNEEMEETITHFILQLVTNTRSNVVCGVAVLNLDFVTALLVAISSLFIFLLQYDITFEALTKTHMPGNPKLTELSAKNSPSVGLL